MNLILLEYFSSITSHFCILKWYVHELQSMVCREYSVIFFSFRFNLTAEKYTFWRVSLCACVSEIYSSLYFAARHTLLNQYFFALLSLEAQYLCCEASNIEMSTQPATRGINKCVSSASRQGVMSCDSSNVSPEKGYRLNYVSQGIIWAIPHEDFLSRSPHVRDARHQRWIRHQITAPIIKCIRSNFLCCFDEENYSCILRSCLMGQG